MPGKPCFLALIVGQRERRQGTWCRRPAANARDAAAAATPAVDRASWGQLNALQSAVT
jgi:hypothetical protein